jgi:hypothetical protein
MSALSQQILVGIIVACAAVSSVWKLMPARRRLMLLLAFDEWAARHRGLAQWRARSLRPRIERVAGSGCSGCSAAQIRAKHGLPPRPRRAPRA